MLLNRSCRRNAVSIPFHSSIEDADDSENIKEESMTMFSLKLYVVALIVVSLMLMMPQAETSSGTIQTID